MDAIKTFGDQTDKFSSTFMLVIAGSLFTMLAHFAVSYLYGKQEKEQSSGSNVDLEVSGKWKTRPVSASYFIFPFFVFLKKKKTCLGSHYECVTRLTA